MVAIVLALTGSPFAAVAQTPIFSGLSGTRQRAGAHRKFEAVVLNEAVGRCN
jgi:hypothetical protein